MKKTFKWIGLCFILILLGCMVYFVIQFVQNQKKNQQLITEIKQHYHTYVIVEKGDLYCKVKNQYETCGKIKNTVEIPLEDIQVNSIHHPYFQIKNMDYYLYYKDIKPTKEFQKINPNIVPFDQNIQTKKETNLYQNDHQVITLSKEINVPILYQDLENYYIEYFHQIFYLRKADSIEVVEHQNTNEVTASQIPVLYFEDIESWSNTDNWKEQLEQMKNEKFYTISLSDYEKWLKGNIRLKEKAILLLSQSSVQLGEYQFYPITSTTLNFLNANAVSVPNKAYFYQVKQTTTKEQFQNMLKGLPVILSSMDQKVAVLNYHFFYNPDIGEACNENICLATSKFEEQLKYLKDNGYHTLTMDEFRDWMYGMIEIPEKSVLLTIDDGAAGTGKQNGNKLIPLLEKYDLHATLFLITGWWDIENYRSPNLDIESHTFDMHTMYINGAQLLVSSYEQVINDLNKSIEITKSKKAFCFPFYAYNETAISQVKQVGFELSFIGGNYKASRMNDKYKIPRYPIYKDITMQQFIHMIS